MLRVYAAEDAEVLLRAGDVPKAWTLRGGKTSSKTFTGFRFTGNEADLLLLATAPVYLRGVLMKPQLTLLPPESWSIIGPFPAGPQTPEGLRKAMATSFIPETAAIDLSATHRGEGDRTLVWQQGKTLADANDYKRSMWSKQLGFKNQGISYSVTHIDSPTDRDAELGIMVDYWANAWLNGQPVASKRSRRRVARDGCEFKNSLTRAKIHLRRGRNVLLVKVRGGNGSNAFSGYITNPGDLAIAAK